jgi:hypothetical protein
MKKFCKLLCCLLIASFITITVNSVSYAQSNGEPGNCIIVRAGLSGISNGLWIHYGDRTETVPFNPTEKLSLKELISFKYNVIAQTLSNLEKQGYKVVSMAPDAYNGETIGYTIILHKTQ